MLGSWVRSPPHTPLCLRTQIRILWFPKELDLGAGETCKPNLVSGFLVSKDWFYTAHLAKPTLPMITASNSTVFPPSFPRKSSQETL